MKMDEIADTIIGDLATLANKLRAQNLFRASEVVDDVMISVFGALANDFSELSRRGRIKNLKDFYAENDTKRT